MDRFDIAHPATAFILVAICIGGCTPTPPPPLLSLAGRICLEKPDLGTSKPVTLANDKPVTVTVDDKAGCLNTGSSARVAYAAFDLPQSPDEYLLSITSAPIGDGLFSPKLSLLDGSGKVMREISPDSFMPHGVSLHASLRSRQGERYLIVMSDPDTIGEAKSQIVSGTQITTTGGPIIVQIHTGFENNKTLTNAYNGKVTVAAQPTPKAQ